MHMNSAHKITGVEGDLMPRSVTPMNESRRATNITLSAALLRDARDLGINLSQACERGLAAEIASTRRRRWLEQNHDAMQAWNKHVAQHGLPLSTYRQF